MSFAVRHVRKQGHSLRLTIPSDLVRELGVRDGEPVSMSVQNGVLLVTKLSAAMLADTMLAQAKEKPE